MGRADAVARARGHPLARALRLDKLGLAALEATLRLYRDPARARREIPVLAMLTADEADLTARAERLAALVASALPAASVTMPGPLPEPVSGGESSPFVEIVAATARVGGGALPLLELPGPAVAIGGVPAEALAARLRAGEPPLVGRVERGRLLLDPRTLATDEIEAAGRAVVVAL